MTIDLGIRSYLVGFVDGVAMEGSEESDEWQVELEQRADNYRRGYAAGRAAYLAAEAAELERLERCSTCEHCGKPLTPRWNLSSNAICDKPDGRLDCDCRGTGRRKP